MRRKPFIAACALLVSRIVCAQTLPTEAERLAATGKLWVTVKYFHPALARSGIDWDQALTNVLPNIRAAKTAADYSGAIHALLAVLPNPPATAAQKTDGPQSPQRQWIHHGLPPASGPNPGNFHTAFYSSSSGESIRLPMGGFDVTVPLSEPIPVDGPVVPSPEPDRAYADTPYPAVELRILALYKIWGVIHYFFAYRDLMDEDWDDLLPTFLPRFIAAKDAREYNLAIAELLTHAADSQTRATSATLTDYFGAAPPGIRLRLVEKQAIVTAVLDPGAAAAGVQVGDIIKSVDGETLVDRFKRESPYVSASTLPGLSFSVVARILNGPEGSLANLNIEDRNGLRKQVSLKRGASYNPALEIQRGGDAVQLLPGNIGYADLDRLLPGQVDAMFERFHAATAIVFDARGVNAAAAPYIASRLATARAAAAAIVTGPLTLVPDLPQPGIATRSASYFFVETIPDLTAPDSTAVRFTGGTALLVDERSSAAAEEAGLLFEAANKTEIIGTPSAGAAGDQSNFVVPGGVTISFSGHDVRHANGGKLQRLGLQPNVSVSPTLRGIRAGKDEILEKATQHLSPEHPASKLVAQSTGTGCYFEYAKCSL